MKDIDLKIQIIKKHIEINKIKITDLALEAGYARPYLSSIINQSKQANHGILDHLLNTLNINFDTEKKMIKSIEYYTKKIERALLFKNIEKAKQLNHEFQEKFTEKNIPDLVKGKTIEKRMFYHYYFTNENHGTDDSLYYQIVFNIRNKNYEVVIPLLYDAQEAYRNDANYEAVLLLALSQCYLKTDHPIQAKHHLEISRQALVHTKNYLRLIDCDLLNIELAILNNEFQFALNLINKLEEVAPLTLSQRQELTHHKHWLKIMNGHSYESSIAQRDNIDFIIYQYIRRDEIPDDLQFKSQQDQCFYELVLESKHSEHIAKRIDDALLILKNGKFESHYYKTVFKKALIECLIKNRMYKDAYEIK